MIKYEMLKKITDAFGVSGHEAEVRDVIINQLDDGYYEIRTDKIGNLFVKNPGKKPAKKIVIDAHLDDLGIIVTGATQYGQLTFHPVGGLNEIALLGKAVLIGKDKKKGIFCANGEVKSNAITYKDMYIEVGCETREEAESMFEIGEYGSFESHYVEFGDGFLKARNFDDRVGCCIMVELLKEKLDVEFTAVFTSREEVGVLGSKAAAYIEHPDYAICLESGASCDIPYIPEDEKVGILNNGVAMSVRNQYSIFDPEFLNYVMGVANKYNIPCQKRSGNNGGCDGQSYQQIGTGAKIVTLVPSTRCIHTPNTVIAEKDYIATKDLTRALIAELSKEKK